MFSSKSALVLKAALLTGLCVIVLACQAHTKNLQEESEFFCQLHDIKYWQGVTDKTIPQLYQMLNRKVREAGFSNDFMRVIKDLDIMENTSIYPSQLYPLAQAKISKLTGLKWECDDYQKFYYMEWKPVESNDNETLLDIRITSKKEIYIVNKSQQRNISKTQLKSYIVNNKITKLIIHTDNSSDSSPNPFVVELLNLLGETGLKKTIIATPL